MKKEMPSVEILNECFEYKSNGSLIWKIRPFHHFKNPASCKGFNTRFSGNESGSKIIGEYKNVYIFGSPYSVHRIVAKMHGIDVSNDIDHIDGDKFNNKIENLRPATRSQNTMNRFVNKSNRTGIKGLSTTTNKQGKKYFHCEISFNKTMHHKFFHYCEENKQLAIDWLESTRLNLHEEFSNHGDGSVLLKDLKND